MFDEDFSSICGEFANLNGDGKVDMEEYLNKEDDYNRIMRTDGEDEDEDYSLDDEESIQTKMKRILSGRNTSLPSAEMFTKRLLKIPSGR